MSADKPDDKTSKFGGLQVRNSHEINEKFTCGWCATVLLLPWQLLCCGTVLCRWCAKKGLSNSEPFNCPFCQEKQERKQIVVDRGVERELKPISIVCYLCAWKGSYKEYLDHLQQMHRVFECSDCHERFFAKNSLEEHRQELCVHRNLPCELPGCEQSIPWQQMKSHYLSDHHQQLLLNLVFAHYNQRITSGDRSEMIQKEYEEALTVIRTVLSVLEVLGSDQMRLKSEVDALQKEVQPNSTKINELNEKEKLNDRHVKDLVDRLTNAEIELAMIRQTLQSKHIHFLDEDSGVTMRFNLPDSTPFSMDSPKVRTSEYGYLFTLRICSVMHSNGEYMSILLTLHKGDYDNLIPFPFPYDLHFHLLDQSPQRKHVMHVLRPDPSSPSVARPTNEKNNEFGIVQFCSLSELQSAQNPYVKDGVFFIRMFVDFLSTANSLTEQKNDMEVTPTNEVLRS